MNDCDWLSLESYAPRLHDKVSPSLPDDILLGWLRSPISHPFAKFIRLVNKDSSGFLSNSEHRES